MEWVNYEQLSTFTYSRGDIPTADELAELRKQAAYVIDEANRLDGLLGHYLAVLKDVFAKG